MKKNDSTGRLSHSNKKNHTDLGTAKRTPEPLAELTAAHHLGGPENDSLQSNLSISPTELNRLEVAAKNNIEKEIELAKVRAELDSLLHYARSIQTEVERNYIEAQEQRTINSTLRKKINNLRHNFPEIVLFESIKQAEPGQLRWKIDGIEADEGKSETIDLELKILDDNPRLLVRLSSEMGQPFSDSFVTLNPYKLPDGRLIITPNSAVHDPEYLMLRMLSNSELRLLDNALIIAKRFGVKSDSNAQSELIQEIRKSLNDLPRTLRFHNAAIEETFPLPTYESLQFTLQDTFYGSRHWETFVFKLTATRSKGVLTQPRLEFHLFDAVNKPFENWYAESTDSLGQRLELRFDTHAEAFDAAVWKKLSAVDQLQLLSIISRLPILLDLVPINSESNMPDVSSWKALALSLQKIFLKHGLPTNTFSAI